MSSRIPAAPSPRDYTLIRNARQLLTLQGPSGARRGPAMSGLGVIPGASILIRNGVIEDIGPARRVENLAGARHAIEIHAAGKIVMPAFVDAALTLIFRENAALLTMSKRVAQARVEAASVQCARQGCLTVGARTPGTSDLRAVTKVLRAQQACQSRPLRIRSVLAPRFPSPSDATGGLADFLEKCLPCVRDRKLAGVVEFDLPGSGHGGSGIPGATLAAAGMGFAVSFRSQSPPGAHALRLALDAGAMSLLAPSDPPSGLSAALASAGCVRLYPAREVLDPAPASAASVRGAISAGLAIALASDSTTSDPSPGNLYSLLAPAVARLGLTIEEAITATTWNPACALRLAQSAGSLEAGRSADLIMLDLPDYRDLALVSEPSAIILVMRAGHRIFGAH